MNGVFFYNFMILNRKLKNYPGHGICKVEIKDGGEIRHFLQLKFIKN